MRLTRIPRDPPDGRKGRPHHHKEHARSVIATAMMNRLNHRKFFGINRLGALLFLALGALAWAGPSLAAAGAPQAVIGATTFDFGQIYEDRALTHTFVIKNTGDAPLKIEDVDPDCACTASSYDKTIPPGGEGGITLTIKPFSVLHQFKKETKVRLNDPERPALSLVMVGKAQPFIEIQPSHIVRLRGKPGEDIEGQVRFTSHLPGPWKITEVRNSIPDKIDVTLKPEVPDKVYVLEVHNKWQQSGPYAGLVELLTTSKERPRLIVRVFGELYLPSAGGQ
ncbi:MAG: DUF1573 domain-containing protein [Syntrophobacterales bacterium]|nr:DUF1573 domain-containing protein [Syntrophobacterales bacterium]